MNEAEWLACNDWHEMLLFLRRRKGIARRQAGRRKLQLLACGCCREWALLIHPASREVLELTELFADGRVDEERLVEAHEKAIRAIEEADRQRTNAEELQGLERARMLIVADAVMRLVARGPVFDSMVEAISCTGRVRGMYCETDEHSEWLSNTANLVRDIFGNPFRLTQVKRAWRTATVVQLARGIYLEHAFDRMPILADAIQEAGCDEETILSHCRDPQGFHARGCWVVDQVLGKK